MPRARAVRRLALAVAAVAVAAVAAGGASPRDAAAADAPKPRGFDPKALGPAVHATTAADGLAVLWRGPRAYDAARGVGVTVILHGSHLDRRWGFANHAPATFRPDDVVLVPDGTTPDGRGGFNFLDGPKDTKRLAALLAEARKAWKVRAVYLYGHSQGSFFALAFAGERPDEVAGVVAHASGVWASTRRSSAGHRQAITLMHGTADPVVPYAQSVGALEAYREAGYPLVRLRSLEGWNHWPAEHNSAGGTPHTSLALAGVEGLTTDDPDRLAACLELLADVKAPEEHDWAALGAVARRVAGHPAATAALAARARKAADDVDARAKRAAAALADVKPGAAPAGVAPALLPIVLRQLEGEPAVEALAAAWAPTLAAHRDAGIARLRRYGPAARKAPPDVATAFEEGVAAVAEGYLWPECADRDLRATLLGWAKDAKKHRLSKAAVQRAAVLEVLERADHEAGPAWARLVR